MLVGLSGVIGSGKSVVAGILRVMGYPVYDCDAEAGKIMECDVTIHHRLCEHIHPDAVSAGRINRKLISEIVFNDKEALRTLNSIVHKAVFDDVKRWARGGSLKFVESAILHSSGLIDYVDAEWCVTAPVDVRVERVMKRSALRREDVLARIRSQASEEELRGAGRHAVPVSYIDNSPETALLPQIHEKIDLLLAR